MKSAAADRYIGWAVLAFAFLTVGLLSNLYAGKLALAVGKPGLVIAVVIFAALAALVGLVALCVVAILGWRTARTSSSEAIQEYFRSLAPPIAVVAVNAVMGHVAHEELYPNLLVRIFAVVWAGWLVARAGFGIWKSAAAGLLLDVLDHVLIKGGGFILTAEWLAFAGVLISFAMFALIPIALGAVGGMAGRRRLPPSNPAFNADAQRQRVG